MRPAGTSNRAALRQPPHPGPSRPRYETGRRPPTVTPFELAERARLGAIIRAARTRIGMPQGEAAQRLGIFGTDLSGWELGRDAIPPARRNALAELYGIDPALLHGLDLSDIAATPLERAVLAGLRRMPNADQQALLELVPQ